MKVICISHEDYTGGPKHANQQPEIGEDCEVIGEKTMQDHLGRATPCYRLAAYRWFVYDQRNFAPCNGPDETEIAEARAEREGVRLDCELVSVMERIEYA